MTNPENTDDASPELDVRKRFLRDAVVFPAKLLVDGLRDLILLPAALVASGIDLIKREEVPGRHFYDVVHFGRQTEQWINLFEAADRAPEADQPRPEIDAPSLDEFVDQFEQKLKAKHETGDLSTSAKQVVDQILDAARRAMTNST